MASSGITMYAVFKGARMVEPAFPSRTLADQVCAAYGRGYVVRIVEVV